MNFNSTKDKICEKIKLYQDLINKKENSFYYKKCGNGQVWEQGSIDYENFKLDKIEEIQELIIKLQKESNDINTFFPDTSSINYITTINHRVKSFIDPSNFYNRQIFFEYEEEYYKNISKNRVLENSNGEKYSYHHFIKDNTVFTENLNVIKEVISRELNDIKNNRNASIIIADSIVKRILKFQDEISDAEALVHRLIESNDEDWVVHDDYANKIRRAYTNKLKYELEQLQKTSKDDTFYFFDCPLKVYQKHIDSRKEKYLNKNIDADDVDFFKEELEYFLDPPVNRVLNSLYEDTPVHYNYFCKNISSFHISNEKKINLVIEELKKLGVQTSIETSYSGKDGDIIRKTPVYKKINKKNKATSIQNIIDKIFSENKRFEQTLQQSLEESSIDDFQTPELESYEEATVFDFDALYVNLQNFSLKENYYYFDCPFNVYLEHYSKRKKQFIKKFNDAEELDFIKEELEYFYNPESNRNFRNSIGHIYFYHKSVKDIKEYTFSLNKKKDYLTEKLLKLGWSYTINEVKDEEYNPLSKSSKLIFYKTQASKTDEAKASGNNQSKQKNESLTKSENDYNNDIFRNKEAQDWYYTALDELNAFSKGKVVKHAFQAKANSIFCNEDCKAKIFKYELSLKDYIGFLVEYFEVKIKDKTKLSNGIKHSNEVKRLINQFVKSAE